MSCTDADALRTGLSPVSSITNFIGGEVINWQLPPVTATTWADEVGREVLRDELDDTGCRHYHLDSH